MRDARDPEPGETTMATMTKADARKRLTRVEAEYRRALNEIGGQPGGNGFATQEQMRKAAETLYGSTIGSLRRAAGIW
jgi:hypothetical protein